MCLHSLRNSTTTVIIIVTLGLAADARATADEASRVGVLGFGNFTGSESYQGAADTVSNTVEITLSLLGEHTILPLDDEIDPRNPDDLRNLARAHRLDYLLSGGIFLDADNDIQVSMSVYDNALDRNVAEKNQIAGSLFDIFDTVDEVLVDVIGKFSNRHIGWGDIRLVNVGSPGSYSVRLDDIELGNDSAGFSNILIGKRRIEISQDRPFGPLVVFDDAVEIRENESVTVEFEIPGITTTERVSLDAIWKAVDDAVAEGDKKRAEEHFSAVFDLLVRSDVSEELAALHETWKTRFAGIDSELSRRAADDKALEAAVVEETQFEPVATIPSLTPITVDRRIFRGERYTMRGIEYRPRAFKGYPHFYADLFVETQLPRSFYELAHQEKTAEAVAYRRFSDGAIMALVGLSFEAAGAAIFRFSMPGLLMIVAGSTLSVVGAFVEIVGAIQTAKHRPSKLVIPEYNRYASGEKSLAFADANNPRTNIPESFVVVEGGEFVMGSPEEESGRDDDEKQHRVAVSNFHIAKYEVTHKAFVEFLNNINVSPGGSYNGNSLIDVENDDCAIGYRDGRFYFEGNRYADTDDTPVMKVTWYGAVEYCNWLSRKGGLTPVYSIDKTDVAWRQEANGYRLPTESEWEYAARGGKNSRGYTYAGVGDPADLSRFANFASSDIAQTDGYEFAAPVGSMAPNELGVYDMSGNVWEWVWDLYDDYSSGRSTDPAGPSIGFKRAIRGGSWTGTAEICRVADRRSYDPGYSMAGFGFRVAVGAGAF